MDLTGSTGCQTPSANRKDGDRNRSGNHWFIGSRNNGVLRLWQHRRAVTLTKTLVGMAPPAS